MGPEFKPRIAISSGDPAGIGPEVTVKALADPALRSLAYWIVVGENWVLKEASSLPWKPDVIIQQDDDLSGEMVTLESGTLSPGDLRIGELSPACGKAGLAYIRKATELCLSKRADAMVTAPVNKEAIVLSGIGFTGHTEYIAELCGAAEARMLLANDRMRVVHVTTHCSLAEAACVSEDHIYETIMLGHKAMLDLGFQEARIAVCGLNPHAGENGLFGHQESDIIEPAIDRARRRDIECSGPFPADTLFLQAFRGEYDLVVAMYHDQGHIPMKLMDFENTVNVSLGLPIIRTSVDHGTAFDLTGQDKADPENMKMALRFAVKMAVRKNAGQ